MKKTLFLLAILFNLILVNSAKAQSIVNWEWTHNFNVRFNDIEYSNGYIYSVGSFSAPSITLGAFSFVNNGGTDFVITKMDTLGNVIWANSYGGSGNDNSLNLTIDSNDNVYITGTFNGSMNVGTSTLTSNGGSDIFILKLDFNGNILIANSAGNTGNDIGKDIAVDTNGNIYVIGKADNLTFGPKTCPSNVEVVLKYDNLGNPIFMQWLRGITTPSTTLASSPQLVSIKYSYSDNSIVFGGVFTKGGLLYGDSLTSTSNMIGNSGTIYNLDIFMYKINLSLNEIWRNNISSGWDKTYDLVDIVIDSLNGDIYYDYQYPYTLSGNMYSFWEKINTSGTSFSGLTSISSSPPNIFNYPGKLTLENGILYSAVYKPNSSINYCSDFYLLKYNTNTHIQSLQFISPDQYNVTGITVHNGASYIGGNSSISKECISNCLTNLIIQPAPDVILCGSYASIGNPSCYYVKGGHPGYTYSWSPLTGLSNSTISNPIVTGLTIATSYTLTATDTWGDKVYDTILVTPITPPSITVNVSPNPVCQGSAVTISAYGALNYSFSSPLNSVSSTFTYTPNSTSSYGVWAWDTLGCSSYKSFTINVINSTQDTTATSVCSNQIPYVWDGQSINTSGLYTHTYSNSGGCDSLKILDLTILSATSSDDTLTICSNQVPYIWNGQLLSSGGIYTHTAMNSVACDSVSTLNFNILSASFSNEVLSICSNQVPYNWNGLLLSSSGTYTFTTTNAVGCDSICTLNLNINSTSTSNETLSICSNQVPYNWNGQLLSSSGAYVITSMNSVGCDSVSTLNLIVEPLYVTNTYITICSNQSPYNWNGQNLTSTGIYSFTTTSASGCDSISMLDLIINPMNIDTINAAVCNNQLPYSWFALYLTASGYYPTYLTNIYGCDSTLILHLTVNDTSANFVDTSICNNQIPYTWNGQQYSASGQYSASFINMAGCDSIDILSLVINPNPTPIITQSATSLSCINVAGSSFQWYLNGAAIGTNNSTLPITQNGTYVITEIDTLGCSGSDTLVVTNLSAYEIANSNNLFTIYPNPTIGRIILQFDLKTSSIVSAKLLDMTGQSVMKILNEEKNQKGNHQIKVDLNSAGLADGIYIMIVELNGSIATKRIVYRRE